jgi:transcriptional regulator with XRE-family HTH domain
MANSVNERLKTLRNTLNLSQRNFSSGIYISQSFYARLEQGVMRVNERIIELMCNKYNVNKDWILTGNGTMFSNIPPDARLELLNGIFNKLNDIFQDYLITQAKELLKVQEREEMERGMSAPQGAQ